MTGRKNKPGAGRPREWTEERIDEMADDLLAWSEQHTSLFLARWLSNHALHREHMATFRERSTKFYDAYKIALARLEGNIAEAVASGEIPPAFGIFALKQKEHGGWTDRQEIKQEISMSIADQIQKAFGD